MKTTHLQKPIKIEVAGHLEEKRGVYQMILSWRWPDGDRDRKSISSKLPVKGNKKRAEIMLAEKCSEWETAINDEYQRKMITPPTRADSVVPDDKGDILFADFIEYIWLESLKQRIRQKKLKLTTYGGYWLNVTSAIAPYFREKGIRIKDLTAENINDYYEERYKTVMPITVEKQHANIHSALKYAVKMGYITHSVMDKVDRPSADSYKAKFLKQSEVIELFDAIQGHKLEIPVILGAFYGLRRSEVVGLKWGAIDFEANSISIEHTVTITSFEGKTYIIENDTTKSKSSYRTLPLVPQFRARLLALKEEQEHFKALCGNCYDKVEGQYICVNQLGKRIKPNYITVGFPEFMKKHGFRRLRFHDLRHSAASLLLANGVSLKQIQEWLGHSTFAITADTYAHLEFNSKQQAAQAMTWIGKTSLGKLPAAEEPASASCEFDGEKGNCQPESQQFQWFGGESGI